MPHHQCSCAKRCIHLGVGEIRRLQREKGKPLTVGLLEERQGAGMLEKEGIGSGACFCRWILPPAPSLPLPCPVFPVLSFILSYPGATLPANINYSLPTLMPHISSSEGELKLVWNIENNSHSEISYLYHISSGTKMQLCAISNK